MTDIKSTYAAFAEAFLDEQGGRFKTINQTIHTAATPTYPELPENNPFHHDPVPDEPPLGFSVEDHQPVGTAKEIAASLEKLGEAARSGTSPVGAVETASPSSTATDDNEPPRAV